jgi:sigma-B regulation protein RsbU (phosphoserine phosphatase)
VPAESITGGSPRRGRTLAYAVLAALFLLMVTAAVRDASDSIDLLRNARTYARAPFHLGDANWGVVGLLPEAEAEGMKFGDTLLAVNDRPVDGYFSYYGFIRQSKPGDQLRVRMRSPGPDNPVRDLSIQLQPFRSSSGPASLSEYVVFALQVFVLPVICIGLGFWVAAVRIGDPSAWLLLVLLLSLAGGGTASELTFGREGAGHSFLAGFTAFRGGLLFPALMLFGIVFPERLPLDRRWPWLKWTIAGYLVLVATLVAVGVALWTHHLAWARRFTSPLLAWLTGVEGDFGGFVRFAAVVVCAGSLGWKAFTAPSRDARRRLMLLFLGAVPFVVALLIILVAGRWEYVLPTWSYLPLFTMVLVFPLTTAYVIVVHRAIDVRVVIRQGLQYVLARNGIRAIRIALLVGATIVATLLLRGDAGIGRVAAVVAGLVAVAAIGGRFADRLRNWVDRRFFREAYEADAILSDLATKVRTIVETRPLLETVTTRIAESLHVPRIAILLYGEGAFEPAYALGYGEPPAVAIPADGVTAARLRKQQHAIVRFEDADSWVQATRGEERHALETLKPELLLPLSLNEKILGIVSLGPKQSEEPFSKTDIRLLDSVAAQTGLALENGRLTAAVAAEVAARAKQARDIEIARDVQQRLLPQEFPPIPGLDYAGTCRAALGVGGDYYDFIPLSKTMLGIAIGDVSGKGIPAALLMASLRAYLRGAQTIHHQADLTAVMRNLNMLVYESSAANRYATFFYGELDVSTRVFTYVNAGHNPPMLFRGAGGGDVLRLDTGGPVIGLIEECDYQQGRVTLASGDVLVAYTDGISEAMNAANEEWGEDRFMAAVEPNRLTSARALIDRLMVSADAFVAGAPQHDDMTLLVVRAL